jgi:hypothetical protein
MIETTRSSAMSVTTGRTPVAQLSTRKQTEGWLELASTAAFAVVTRKTRVSEQTIRRHPTKLTTADFANVASVERRHHTLC